MRKFAVIVPFLMSGLIGCDSPSEPEQRGSGVIAEISPQTLLEGETGSESPHTLELHFPEEVEDEPWELSWEAEDPRLFAVSPEGCDRGQYLTAVENSGEGEHDISEAGTYCLLAIHPPDASDSPPDYEWWKAQVTGPTAATESFQVTVVHTDDVAGWWHPHEEQESDGSEEEEPEEEEEESDEQDTDEDDGEDEQAERPGTPDLMWPGSSNQTATAIYVGPVRDGTGKYAKYDVRISESPIRWGSAESLPPGSCTPPTNQVPTGRAEGELIQCAISDLEPGTEYQVQAVAYRGTLGEDAVFGDLSEPITIRTTEAEQPERVSDLRPNGNDGDVIGIIFTQVDDGTGEPAKYDVRYSEHPIHWGSAESADCDIDREIGANATCAISGLEPGTLYQVQVVSYRGTLGEDAVFGDLSDTVSVSTLGSPDEQEPDDEDYPPFDDMSRWKHLGNAEGGGNEEAGGTIQLEDLPENFTITWVAQPSTDISYWEPNFEVWVREKQENETVDEQVITRLSPDSREVGIQHVSAGGDFHVLVWSENVDWQIDAWVLQSAWDRHQDQ